MRLRETVILLPQPDESHCGARADLTMARVWQSLLKGRSKNNIFHRYQPERYVGAMDQPWDLLSGTANFPLGR